MPSAESVPDGSVPSGTVALSRSFCPAGFAADPVGRGQSRRRAIEAGGQAAGRLRRGLSSWQLPAWPDVVAGGGVRGGVEGVLGLRPGLPERDRPAPPLG